MSPGTSEEEEAAAAAAAQLSPTGQARSFLCNLSCFSGNRDISS